MELLRIEIIGWEGKTWEKKTSGWVFYIYIYILYISRAYIYIYILYIYTYMYLIERGKER